MAGLGPAIHVFFTALTDRPRMAGWVYIMTNRRNGTLYVGVTSDLVRRVWQHQEGVGSSFVRRYGLTKLVPLHTGLTGCFWLDSGGRSALRISCIVGASTLPSLSVGSIAKEGFKRRYKKMHAEHADSDRLHDLSGRVIGCAFTVFGTPVLRIIEEPYTSACHCEERSDEAISVKVRNLTGIASLAARNDSTIGPARATKKVGTRGWFPGKAL